MSWFRWQGIPTQEIGVRSLGPEDASRRRKWQPTPVSSPGKCHGQRSLMGRSPWVVSKLGSIQQLRTEVIPKTTLKCVCVCVCVSVSPLAVLESVSESSCISASVSPDSQPPARSSGPGLSQALWFWLRSLRRPAVSLGVGACECLCVCLCACLWLVCSLRKVEGLAWGQRGASVVRRGGAEALRSTAPPWLLVGLGTGQVLGKLGAQVSLCLGPQELQRPLGRGGWEAAGAEDRHLRGRAGLSSEWDRGEAPLSERGQVWSGRGWKGAETSTPLSPAPRPRAHACTQALPVNGGSWKPLGPPGPARRLLLWCWRCSGGRAGVSRLESGRGSCGSSTARPATRGAARWPDLQGRAKGRRSARLLGRPKPTASGSGPISLKAPDLV